MDDLDRLRNDLLVLETTGGSSGRRMSAAQMSAFASCSRQIGEPLNVVLRAVSTGRLGDLIQARKGSGSNVEKRNVERIRNLYRKREIAARMVPPW